MPSDLLCSPYNYLYAPSFFLVQCEAMSWYFVTAVTAYLNYFPPVLSPVSWGARSLVILYPRIPESKVQIQSHQRETVLKVPASRGKQKPLSQKAGAGSRYRDPRREVFPAHSVLLDQLLLAFTLTPFLVPYPNIFLHELLLTLNSAVFLMSPRCYTCPYRGKFSHL